MVKRSLLKERKEALPPPPGHGDFWATVHVKLHVPLSDVDDPAATPAQWYYRNFGIRAVPTRVHVVIAEAIKDGAIDRADTEWHLADSSDVDRAVRKSIVPVSTEGIWYKSGRILYADPDLEPPPT